MSTLEFERVSLRFPHSSRPAVEECSFSVASGQLVVILGPSGCGKTTLLKMVNRLLEPTQGQIR
ncbi:ATP-binding cassette domain-containing protein, partial [Synechococcus sp. OH2]